MFRPINSVKLVSIRPIQSLGKSQASQREPNKPKKYVSKFFQKGSREVN